MFGCLVRVAPEANSMVRQLSLLAPLVGAYLLATTYPFSLKLNGVEVNDDSVSFNSSGLLWWSGPPLDLGVDRFRVIMRVRPGSADQEGPARIFAISQDHYNANVVIGQDGDALVIRLRREGSDGLGNPPFVWNNVFSEAGHDVEVEIDLQRTRLSILVDGQLRLARSFDSSPVYFWDGSYTLAVGNEHTWERPWLGEIYAARLIVGSDEFDLLADGNLSRPRFGERLSKRTTMLSPQLGDWIVNFVFLIPLGFLTASVPSRGPVLLTVGLWIIVPTLAEMTQVLLPSRSPSISDIVLNFLGAVTGAILLLRFRDWQTRFLINVASTE
jgi:hypothetical protein